MSGGSLTFDRYHQDQAVQVTSVEEGHERFAGLVVNDQPEFARTRLLLVKSPGDAGWSRKRCCLPGCKYGRDSEGFSRSRRRQVLSIGFARWPGRSRLVLSVTESGVPVIQFLDPAGKVVRTISE